MKNSYKLVNLIDDSVVTEDSTQALCRFIDDAGLGKEEYYIILTQTNHEQYNISHDLATYRMNKKNKNKGDVDVEPITVKGEVKDDQSQKVQRDGQGLRLPEYPDVVPERKPRNTKNKQG